MKKLCILFLLLTSCSYKAKVGDCVYGEDAKGNHYDVKIIKILSEKYSEGINILGQEFTVNIEKVNEYNQWISCDRFNRLVKK